MRKWFLIMIISVIIVYNCLNFLTTSDLSGTLNQKGNIIEVDLTSLRTSESSEIVHSSNNTQLFSDSLELSESQALIETKPNSGKINKNSSDFLDVENFVKDASEKDIQSESHPDASCMYPDYEFTSEEVERIWNYKPYSKCSTESNDSIYIENDQLIVKCESGDPPEFYEHSIIPERLGGSRKIIGKWTQTQSSISNKNFTFIKCQEKSIYSMIFLRFSQTVSDKAKRSAQEFKGLHQVLQENTTSVLFLTFDSLSRGSTYRNLNKTVKYLKTKSSAFNFYEFKNPAVPEIHTQDNMAQIIYGDSLKKMQDKLGKRAPFLNSKPHLDYQQRAIWSHYSSLGYVTMFLHDSVWDYLSYLTGGTILCDYVFANYWKVVWSVYGFHDHQDGKRCIGNQHSHNISFGYTHQFFQLYPNNNKFSYLHLDAAHENQGNIQSVDEDLKAFLENLVGLFNERNESFVIFLIGDHGQRRNEMQFDVRNSYEGRQALTFLLTSKSFGNNQTEKNLLYNQGQLFSRFDLHLSLKDISFSPYLEMNDRDYEQLKLGYEFKDVKSLFREKISHLRTCDDIGVAFELCPCTGFVKVTSISDFKLLEETFKPIILDTFSMLYQNDTNCKIPEKLEIVDFLKFTSSLADEGFETLYKIQINAGESELIQVKIRGCTEKRIKETKNILVGSVFVSTFYLYHGLKMFYQVYEILGPGFCGDIIKLIS